MRCIRMTTALLAVVLLSSLSLQAQFPVTLQLNARSGDVITTPPTKSNARYRITVTGTYSQWPQFTDCHGVDAAWVYDVPKEEIDAYRWPPATILGTPFVTIPHWVGDSTAYAFPPKGLGVNPLFELSFRKYLGFRINNEPLPPMQLDRTFHRYQVTMAGTDQPISFQILDSTYNVALGAVIPRYEDNCGGLTVVVEEILAKDINICNATPIKSGNDVVGIRVDASIVRVDSTSLTGTRNELVSKDQLGIVADGKFICPDSLVCDTARTEPVSICLVVDVSGSMSELISYNGDFVQRIDALKSSIHSFMRKLKPGDSLSLIQFNSTVVLSQNWTTDTAKIGTAIDRIFASGSTAFYSALIQGLDKLSTHARQRKALVALTDGLNNQAPGEIAPVIDAIRKANVPLYLIALGFAGTADERLALDTMRLFVAAAPSGKVYQITTGQELEAVYTEFAENFAKDDCCRLYFRIPPCDKGQTKRTLRLVFVDGESTLSKKLTVDCDLKTTSVAPGHGDIDHPDALEAIPTPSHDVAHFDVISVIPGNIRSEVYSIDGMLLSVADHGFADIGVRRITIPTESLAAGVYVCRIIQGASVRTAQFIVQH